MLLANTTLRESFLATRDLTVELCSTFETEDFVIQAMPDASPAKWHLGHTTWFFENFILAEFLPGYHCFHEKFHFIFNSYYKGAGEHIYRPNRGLLARPTVSEVMTYRQQVNETMLELLEGNPDEEAWRRLEIGIHHEQQHQELLMTDTKYNFSVNPLLPAVFDNLPAPASIDVPEAGFVEFSGGTYDFGAEGDDFCFDNELPRHGALLYDFAIADRLVTNGEYLQFIEDGGYSRPELWLSDGWDVINHEKWQAPLYWRKEGQAWFTYTLGGLRELNPAEPVCHVSFFEADAYARYRGCRLPSEYEWELAMGLPDENEANLLASKNYHPVPASGTGQIRQAYGDTWEYTYSAYLPYPGYQPLAGTLGEYNGKFMNDQRVLKGGSCVTPPGHIRSTYRNFFQSGKRWQFTGIRLARDL